MFSLSWLFDYKKDPLSYRLLFWILFVSAIFTLIMTSIQLYDDYQSDRKNLNESLLQITDSTLPAVGHALWTVNKPQLDTILNGVLDQRDMQYVKVIDTYGNVVTSMGDKNAPNLVKRKYPIIVEELGKKLTIGTLHVSATLENIYQALYHKVLVILGTQGVKTFLMSLCILLLVERLIIRHLIYMGDWARQIKDGASSNNLNVQRKPGRTKDAFDYLVESINTMKKVLNEELEERKHIEKNLQDSEERFRALYEKNPNMLFSVSADGIIMSVNHSGLSHLGFTKQEMINQPVANLFYDPDKDAAEKNLSACFANPEDVHIWELRKKCKDGRIIYVKEAVRIIKDVNNEDIALIVCEDVTQHKQAEETIYRYGRIFEESLNEIYQFDVETLKFLQVNKAAQENLGYSMTELSNMTPLDIKPDYTKEQFMEEVSPLLNKEQEMIVFETVHQRKDRSLYDVEVHLQMLIYNEGVVFTAIILDISDRKHANHQLEYQATHDSLTGLINRQEFERRADRLLNTVNNTDQIHALCFMDLDQFKVINDTCGHIAGDELLRQVSHLLDENVRKRDTLARLGGDEFGLLMEHCSLDDAERVASAIRNALEGYQFAWDDNVFKVTVSIGLIQINESITELTDLLKLADSACYMAKDKGRNRVHIYRPGDKELALRHGEMQWVSQITRALDEDRFMLMAQPIIPLAGEKHLHYELLLRMLDEKGNIIMPGAFLPAAERYSLTNNIDYWVVTHAIEKLIDHPEFLEQIEFCAINLSGHSFNDEGLLEYVINLLEKTGIPGSKLCFEITETAVIAYLQLASKFINKLKEYGCQFSLDDFGSGLSSFGYLKNLSVDYLKIDGMFVRDIADDPIDRAMVKSINEIGQVMGMKTIAEFVENDIILGMLKEIGVNYAQGYGVGELIEFDELIQRGKNISTLNAR